MFRRRACVPADVMGRRYNFPIGTRVYIIIGNKYGDLELITGV